MIPGKTENRASTLILAVGGYAAYTLLVANITNAASCILHLPLTSTTVFAVALALAAGIMLLERRFTHGWPVANYYKLYGWVVVVIILIAAAVAFLCCPVICPATCSCGVSSCHVKYFGVYAECICGCIAC
jgi:succinate dehydrogenase/fumarate reductase flavoprotein subunit